ncbi:MAG: SH3 domain-containing protein [Cypionkella sp.]|nr:SH3 domain-containing protein [Cypionkella sp.]
MRTAHFALIALVFLIGCNGVAGSRAVVDRVAQDDLLKLRAGPGLGYRIVLGLPNGTELVRRGCVTELGQEWCRVSLSTAPGITGYVSADYLAARE